VNNLKDQLKRLHVQQILAALLLHEAMKKNEKDNEAREKRHTDTFGKAAVITLLNTSSDEVGIKKKLVETGFSSGETSSLESGQVFFFFSF
jgi:hypothetical protein